MGIMDMFRAVPGQPVTPAAQPSQLPTPGNPNAPTPNPAAPTPAPVDGTTGATADPNQSPMAAFEKLWQNDTTNKAASAPAPLFDLDHAKLAEAVKSADFTRGIDPAVLQKAQSGDAVAFQAVLNSVAQQAFTHQTMAATKLIEQALDRRMNEMTAKMPDMVRSASVRESLAESPIFTHEATRPLMDALQVQLANKYPQASAAQIATHAKQYIADFAKLAAGDKPDAQTLATSKADDWSAF